MAAQLYLLGMLTAFGHLFTQMMRHGSDLESLRAAATWVTSDDIQPRHISIAIVVLILGWPLYWLLVAMQEPPRGF